MVSTLLKNISQNGNLPQVGVKIKNMWNHHLELMLDQMFIQNPEEISENNGCWIRFQTPSKFLRWNVPSSKIPSTWIYWCFFFVGHFRIIKRTPNPKPGGQNPTMSAKQTQFVGLWVLGCCEQHENPPMNVNLVVHGHGGIWIILLTQYEQVQSWVIGESFLPKIVGKKSKNIFEFSPRVPIAKGIRFQAPHSQDQLTAR